MRRQRSDANQMELVTMYRKLGVSVLVVSGQASVDLVVAARGVTDLVEVKDGSKPPSERRLTTKEQDFHDAWPARVWIVMNQEDVYAHIQDMQRRAMWLADGRLEHEARRTV